MSNRRNFMKSLAAAAGMSTSTVAVVEEEKDNPILMFVVRCDRRTSDETLSRIKEAFEQAMAKQPSLKDIPVIVLDSSLDLGVVRRNAAPTTINKDTGTLSGNRVE